MGKNTPDRQKFIIGNLKFEIDEIESDNDDAEINENSGPPEPKIDTRAIAQSVGIL